MAVNETVNNFVSSGLESVAIKSGGTAAAETANTLTNLTDTENSLGTITITGDKDFTLADVDVNTAETATAAKTTAATLTTIDGSTAKGALNITAGDNDVSANVTTTYNGLTIKGGSGNDIITNAAINGVVEGGAGNDNITVTGKGATVTTGSGTDTVTVSAQDVTLNFGEGVDTAVITLGNANNGSTSSVDHVTTINGAAAGDKINSNVAGVTTTTNMTSAIASNVNISSLEAALAQAAGAAQNTLAYFTWSDGDTYLLIDKSNNATAALAEDDCIVKLAGTVTFDATATGGVLTVA